MGEKLHRLMRGNYRIEAHLNYKVSTWTCLQDNPHDLNWSLGYNNHILDTAPVDYDKPRLGRYGDVTVETITRTAREIFRRENLPILTRGPKGKIPVDRINAALSRLNCVEEMN